MNKHGKTLVLILSMGAGIVLMDMPIRRRLSFFADVFEIDEAIAVHNHTVGSGLRKTSNSSSSSKLPDASPISTPVESIPKKFATDQYTDEEDSNDKSISRQNTTAELNNGKNETSIDNAVNATENEKDDLCGEALTIMNETERTDPTRNFDVDEVLRVADAPIAKIGEKSIWNEDIYTDIQTQATQIGWGDKIIHVGDEKGYINKNGQLVVDVNETYLFWNDGQKKLCNLLQNMTFVNSLDEMTRSDLPSTVLNVTMDCIYHNKFKQGFGQGNWITAIYAARMAAFLAGVDFKFQCLDGQSSKMNLLLPWFDKYQVATKTNRTRWPHGGDRPTAKEACPPKYPYLRIDKMAYEIQDDVRKMAVSLVGTRDEVRRHPDISVDEIPLIPNVQLDDVALHFRCGDVLGGARRNDFGMIRFNEYKKWIPKNTESIGILTQPFEKERNRGQDSRKADSCRIVVHALVDYLQAFAPNARISIHNGVNETHPLAYARLVMANYSITSLSSFGIFPIIGTFGQGYFQKGNRGVNPFASYIPHVLSNIHQMEADVRGTGQMMGKSVENLVEWFLNDTTTV